MQKCVAIYKYVYKLLDTLQEGEPNSSLLECWAELSGLLPTNRIKVAVNNFRDQGIRRITAFPSVST